MADQTERLSASAQKGKRNLLFLGVLAWSLALGWLKLESDPKVGLFGIAVKSSIPVVILGLGALVVYNLLSFLLHGPFGDSRANHVYAMLMNPEGGPAKGYGVVYEHVTSVYGKDAFPNDVKSVEHLSQWLNQHCDADWNSNPGTRERAAGVLWPNLTFRARLRLRRDGLKRRDLRLMQVEDLWDVWGPLIIGGSSLVAVLIAVYRYC